MSCALEEVSIVIPTLANEPALETVLGDLEGLESEIIVSSEGTRARSLNRGAEKAQRPFLWFLHADSRVTTGNIAALGRTLEQRPGALHYFDLAYEGGGLPALNAWGANVRSRLFGLPYGDQGVCISRVLFERIGGYPEDAPYGEDLLFVRLARRTGVPLSRIPAKLTTSARKYRQEGWLKLTAHRQWQMLKLMRWKL